MASPRQAVYRGGKWVGARGQQVDQNAAWRAWRKSRRAGQQAKGPRERSVVTLHAPEANPQKVINYAKKSGRGNALQTAAGIAVADKADKKLGQERRKRAGLPSSYNPRSEFRKAGLHPKVDPASVIDAFQTGSAMQNDMTDPISQFLGGFAMAPIGLGMAGYAVGRDVYDAAAHGNTSFKRTRKFGSGIAESYKNTYSHPGDNIGYIAGDVLGALGLVEGGLTRGFGGARALRDTGSVRQALTRPGYEGGSVLHRARPGTAELRAGDAVVRKPLSQNLIHRNLFQRTALKATQAALDAGKSAPVVRPEATFGRIARAEKRILDAVNAAPGSRLAELVQKSSEAERTAVTVRAILGKHAERNPAEAVASMRNAHVEWRDNWVAKIEKLKQRVASGSGTALTKNQILKLERAVRDNEEFIKKLDKALPVLKEQGKRYRELVDETRKVSGLTTTTLKGRGSVTDTESAMNTFGKMYGVSDPEDPIFFSNAARYTDRALRTPRSDYNPSPSWAGVGAPQASRMVGGIGKQRTGKSLMLGKVASAPDTVSARFHGTMKLASADKEFGRLWNAGSARRLSMRQIPVRASGKIGEDLQFWAKKAQDAAAHSPEELAKITDDFSKWLKENLMPDNPDLLGVPKGWQDTAGEIRWVDPAMIKKTWERLGADSKVLKGMDAINNPARILTLFTRPSYAMNIPANFLQALSDQNVRVLKNVRQGLSLEKDFGHQLADEIDAAVGESRAFASVVRTGLAQKGARKLANFWNAAADRWYRRSAFIDEAAKLGYPYEDLPRLFQRDEAGNLVNQADLVEVAQRSRKASVDFDSMTPYEREVVRRFIYFYPWVSRGSAWAGRFMVEHPLQTSAAVALGHEGQKNLKEALGDYLPSWMFSAALLPVGEDRLSNLSNVWTPTTLAQTMDEVRGLGRAAAGTSEGDFSGLTPAAAGLASLAGGGRSGQTGVDAVLAMVPYTGMAKRIMNPAKGTFAEAPTWEEVASTELGQSFPRKVDKQNIRDQGIKRLPRDKRAPLLEQKAVQREYEKTVSDAEKAGFDTAQIPQFLTDAYKLRAKRRAAIAVLDSADPEYQHTALLTEAKLAVRLGLADRSLVQAFSSIDPEDAETNKHARNELAKTVFAENQIAAWHREIAKLKKSASPRG